MDKIIKYAVPAAAAAALFPVVLYAPGRASRRDKAPFMGRNFAHRGLHTRDKQIPENSLAAFRLAVENDYGMELDVQLSKDGQVVVFHDDDLKRVCGVDKRVDELTLNELKQLSLCGTKERIPLFTEVLALVAGRTPMIVELKPGKHNRELCRKTYDILQRYRGDVCIESFDPFIVRWFRFHGRDIIRGQLAMPKERYAPSMPRALRFALSRCALNVFARPHFIAYKICRRPLSVRFSELLGAMRVCWTSHEQINEKGQDAVIFEFYKPKARFK